MKRGDKSTKPVVLVTGSSGLIGSSLIRALESNYTPVGLDVVAPKGAASKTNWIECDMTDDESVKKALETVRNEFDDRLASVVHLAAYYDFSGEPSPLYHNLTVEGTRRLLHELQPFDVEQFVFSSSLLVMKPVEEGEVITESSPTQAEWDYPLSKLDAEAVIRLHRGEIPTVILRIAGVYDEDCHSIPIAQQIARIYEKQFESYFYPGNADHGQAFIHLDDLVDCLVAVVDGRTLLEQHEILLVAEPDVMSYEELQDRIGTLIYGEEWPTIRIPKIVAKAGAWAQEKVFGEDETFIKPWMIDIADAHYPVAIGKVRRTLSWEPKHRLRDTLEAMIFRLKADPKAWYETNGLPLPDELAEGPERVHSADRSSR